MLWWSGFVEGEKFKKVHIEQSGICSLYVMCVCR